MTNIKTSLGLLILRVPMGLFLLIAGAKKMHGGIKGFVDMASQFIPSYVPNGLGHAYLYLVPFGEVLVGALLILGLFGRLAPLLGFLMILSFTMAVTGIKDAQGGPFSANILYLAIMACLILMKSGQCSVDRMLKSRRKHAAEKD